MLEKIYDRTDCDFNFVIILEACSKECKCISRCQHRYHDVMDIITTVNDVEMIEVKSFVKLDMEFIHGVHT